MLRDEQALRYQNGGLPQEGNGAGPDELPLVCRDCGMKFEGKKEFATHVTKFCQGSKYESIEALERAFLELGGNRVGNQSNPAYDDLKLDDLRDYIKESQDLKYKR